MGNVLMKLGLVESDNSNSASGGADEKPKKKKKKIEGAKKVRE